MVKNCLKYLRLLTAIADPVEQIIAVGEIIILPKSTVLISRNGNEYPIADSGAPIRSKNGITH